MNEGWICARCGNSNSPLLLVCGCSSTAASHSSNGPAAAASTAAIQNAGKVLGSRSKPKPLNYDDPNFKSFWEVYPLKRGKASAFRRFKIAVAAGAAPQQIIAAAAAYRSECEDKEPQYIKWPEGWLNAGRWEDEVLPDRAVVADQQAQDAIAETERYLRDHGPVHDG